MTDLSPREREVLRHLAEGKTYEVIAADLGISRATVSHHLTKSFRKLDAACGIDALRALGWLRIPALVLALVLVAACAAPPAATPAPTPAPTPTRSTPVPSRSVAPSAVPDLGWVIVNQYGWDPTGDFRFWITYCTTQPTDWSEAAQFCSGPEEVQVTKAQWESLNPGDLWPYPKAKPNPHQDSHNGSVPRGTKVK